MENPLQIRVAKRIKNISPSQTLSISAIAAKLREEGKDVINLSAGQPDFDTPEKAKTAGIEAIRQGKTKYTAVDGIHELKKSIAKKLRNENKLEYQDDQIIVSCGAKHALYNLFQAILDEGDEVIIPLPFWVSYPEIVKLSTGIPFLVNTTAEQKFKISASSLAAAITPRTRAIILNSPCNPTGAVYSADELKALGEVLSKHPNVLVISDDIYEHIIFGGKTFCSILNVCPELYDRTIIINGVSKAYSMTGWRIGYAAGPADIIKGMKAIQSQSTSNPTSISQYAALVALEQESDFTKELTRTFEERHDYVYQALNEIKNIQCMPAEGSFYIFPDVSQIIAASPHFNDDLELAAHLLQENYVATVPGTAFGAPGHLRISYSLDLDSIKEALARISELLSG